MTSTPVYRQQVADRIAWKGDDFHSKDELAFDLSKRNISALFEISDRIRTMTLDEVGREQCGHPDLDDDLARVYREIMYGRGLVVVRNFPVDGPIEEVKRRYWALCSHFGYPVSNSSFGQRMMSVQREVLPNGVVPAQGIKSHAELTMHTDAADILSLLWVHQAMAGGESQFASGPAAHNTILATWPHILPILYKGFPQHRRNQQPDGQPEVTPYDVPIFSNVNGRICINFTESSIRLACHTLGRTLTDEEAEAMNILGDVLIRQQLELRMERGEVAMANNFAMCHARSEFVDGSEPSSCRVVLRTWMEVPRNDRRLPLGREFFHMENEDLRLGYDLVPGREERIGFTDYHFVPENMKVN